MHKLKTKVKNADCKQNFSNPQCLPTFFSFGYTNLHRDLSITIREKIKADNLVFCSSTAWEICPNETFETQDLVNRYVTHKNKYNAIYHQSEINWIDCKMGNQYKMGVLWHEM